MWPREIWSSFYDLAHALCVIARVEIVFGLIINCILKRFKLAYLFPFTKVSYRF